MDGRRFRRMFVYGGLFAAALGCHRNNTQPELVGLPKPGQMSGAITPKNGPVVSNSMFTSSGPAIGQGPAIGKPIEAAPPKRSGKGLSPDAEVAMADTHVAAAFGDPPATNRDELLDMARLRYQKALKEDPKHKGAILGLARMYGKLNEKERSVEYFQKYLAANSKDAEVPHEVALLYGKWKDWAGAAAWCEVALKIDPDNRTYRKTLGFCQARAGNWEAAYHTLRQVMPEAQARYSLARVMEHLNYPEQSRQWAVMALQADPNHVEAREFVAELDQGYRFKELDTNPIQQTGFSKPQQP